MIKPGYAAAVLIFLLAAPVLQGVDAVIEPEAPTITSEAAVTQTPEPTPVMYRNSIGIEVAMPGRAVPGIMYTRYILDDLFVSFFGGAISPNEGTEVLAAVNLHKMINEFLYLGLGAGYFFDSGRAVFVGIANPSAGIMIRLTPELTLYTEGTAWFIRANINNSIDPLSGSAMLIYKLGVKYNFSWADPLPDLKDKIK